MAATTSNKPLPGTETVVKQEKLDDSHIEIGEIQTEGFPPFQGTFKFAEEEAAGPSEQIDEPPPKRARRAAATRKPVQMSPETDEEDDVEALEAVTKVEDESESEGEAGDDGTGEVDEPEPAFVDVPSASIVDDQPGPSGLGKDGVVPPSSSSYGPNIQRLLAMCKKCHVDVDNILLNKSYVFVNNTVNLQKKRKVFTCEICGDTFTNFNQFGRHKRHHIFRCVRCNMFFSNAQDVMYHVSTTKLVCSFECLKCPKTFTSRQAFSVHMRWHKLFEYYCSQCNAGFEDYFELKRHSVRKHSGVVKYKKHPGTDKVKKQLGTVKLEKLQKQIAAKLHKILIPKEGEAEVRFSCEECFDEFSDQEALDEHTILHKELNEATQRKSIATDDEVEVIEDTSNVHEVVTTVKLASYKGPQTSKTITMNAAESPSCSTTNKSGLTAKITGVIPAVEGVVKPQPSLAVASFNIQPQVVPPLSPIRYQIQQTSSPPKMLLIVHQKPSNTFTAVPVIRLPSAPSASSQIIDPTPVVISDSSSDSEEEGKLVVVTESEATASSMVSSTTKPKIFVRTDLGNE